MKFSIAATALFALSGASVAPAIEAREQSPTVLGTITQSVQIVANTIANYSDTIQSNVAVIANEASLATSAAQAAIIAIRDSTGNITVALNSAAVTLLQATFTATGQINSTAAVLVQSEINQLEQDLQTVNEIVQNLNATVTIVNSDLNAAAQQLVLSQIAAITAAIQPFVSPIIAFANTAASVSVGVQVNGLRGAVNGVLTVVGRLIASIGL